MAAIACAVALTSAIGASAQDCQITIAIDEDVVLGALDFTVSHAAAAGGFSGAGTQAACVAHVDTTLEFFTLDPLSRTLRVQLLSLGGFGGPPTPRSLVTCQYSGGFPGPTELPIAVTSVARPDLSIVDPLPALSITSIICGECGNGVINEGEQCDDGNGIDGDCCSAACRFEIPGSSCNDGNPCSTSDSCTSHGLCLGQQMDCSAFSSDCSLGICQGGACTAVPFNEGAGCDDGNGCTIGDTCSGGSCAGTTNDCSSKNGPCTVGSCQADGSCVALAVNEGTTCDDADGCTQNDVCTFGVCAGTPLDCSAYDGQCSIAVCDPGSGCSSQPLDNGTACDDGDSCTSDDACSAGVCIGVPVDCSHLDVGCSLGICQADGGCAVSPVDNGEACDDRNPCTRDDVCTDATCAGVPLDCTDLDSACTVGACQSDGSCAALAVNDDESCVDGDACTHDDRCSGGLCRGRAVDCSARDGDCVVGTCQPDGSCAAIVSPLGAACDDGDACTDNDTCGESGCAGTAIDCDAAVGQCNTAVCDSVRGCIAEPIPDGATCSDGDACTVRDACDGGSCVGGPPANCDDGDSCTVDACDPQSGCTSTMDDELCALRSICAPADLCVQGPCDQSTEMSFAKVIAVVTETGPPMLQLDARLPFALTVPQPLNTGVRLRIVSSLGAEILHARIPAAGFEAKAGKRPRASYNIARSHYVDLSGLVTLDIRHDDAKRLSIIAATANLTDAEAVLAAQNVTVEIGFGDLEAGTCFAWSERSCETKIAGQVGDHEDSERSRDRTRSPRRARLGRRVTCL